MIGVAPLNNTVQFSFAGMSGLRYQVLRSTNLTQWSVLETMTLPAFGLDAYPDKAPPSSVAFYRAAWVP